MKRLFKPFFVATINVMTKHLASTMTNGGVLHRTRFHQSVIKFGQRYYTQPVSDETATEAGALMLVSYTLFGATSTAGFYQFKIIADWGEDEEEDEKP